MPSETNRHAQLNALLLCVSLFACAGCASLGEKVGNTQTTANSVDIDRIISDLDANDDSIDNFLGRGIFVIESPKIDGKRKFRGNLRFERPQRLFVQGTKLGGAVIVFRMISVDEQFLMEFPGNKEESFYQIEGEEYAEVPFSVSPSDIAQEMFLAEDWGTIRKRNLQIVSEGDNSETVTVELTRKRRVARRLELQLVDADSPRWVIARNTRFNDDGHILAVTELTEYTKIDGALFPGNVDAYFPTEDTRMTFSMKNIQINTDIDPSTFDILARARELNLHRRAVETPGR
jgi:hypothetical protein